MAGNAIHPAPDAVIATMARVYPDTVAAVATAQGAVVWMMTVNAPAVVSVRAARVETMTANVPVAKVVWTVRAWTMTIIVPVVVNV